MRTIKKTNSGSTISTASLPDIVFLLLFFFMVSATIKTEQDQLDYKIPDASNLTKVEKKYLIQELIVGYPKSGLLADIPNIVAGEQMLQIKDIGNWALKAQSELPENEKDKMIVLLKADLEISMGMIADIQEELRKVNIRKILYRTNQEL